MFSAKLKNAQSFFNEYLELTDSPARAILKIHEYNVIAHHETELKPLILDVGCGNGSFSAAAFEEISIIGTDSSREQLNIARKRNVYQSVILADARFLPLKDDCISTLICVSVLEHILKSDDVLKESHRILRRSGVFLFTVPAKTYNNSLILAKVIDVFPKFANIKKIREVYIKWMDNCLLHLHFFDIPPTKRKLFNIGFSKAQAEYLIPDKVLMTWSIVRHLEMIGLPKQLSRVMTMVLERILPKLCGDKNEKTCLCFIATK